MGSLGIMFGVLRRQSGARRGRQRCRRRGHRDHGGQLQPTFRAEYGGLCCFTRSSRCLQVAGRAGGRLDDSQAAWRARELRAPMTLSNAALDAHGECRQRPCRRPQRPFQAAALCMWSYSVLK